MDMDMAHYGFRARTQSHDATRYDMCTAMHARALRSHSRVTPRDMRQIESEASDPRHRYLPPPQRLTASPPVAIGRLPPHRDLHEFSHVAEARQLRSLDGDWAYRL
jgi:hypothetical protein